MSCRPCVQIDADRGQAAAEGRPSATAVQKRFVNVTNGVHAQTDFDMRGKDCTCLSQISCALAVGTELRRVRDSLRKSVADRVRVATARRCFRIALLKGPNYYLVPGVTFESRIISSICLRIRSICFCHSASFIAGLPSSHDMRRIIVDMNAMR